MSRRRLDAMIWINPSAVRYTKASISDCFDNKQTLASVRDKIAQQKMKVEELPPIRVTWKGNAWWSLDNRRLYLLKQLESEKVLDLVEMKQVDVTSAEVRDFQTKCEGRHVEIFEIKSNQTGQRTERQSKTQSSNWLYNCFMAIIFFISFLLLGRIMAGFYKALEKQSNSNFGQRPIS